MNSFPFPMPELINSIITLDDKLNQELLEKIKNIYPTVEEVKLFKSFKGDLSKIVQAELFMV